MPLSPKSRTILSAIAEGRSYEQILAAHPAWTYHDIFTAAAEALGSGTKHDDKEKAYDVEAIRSEHPDAYRKWDDAQDQELRQFHAEGLSVDEIAELMRRQPGGIRSRMTKLGLIGPGAKPA